MSTKPGRRKRRANYMGTDRVLNYLGRLRHAPKRSYAELYLDYKLGGPKPRRVGSPGMCKEVESKINRLIAGLDGAQDKAELRRARGFAEFEGVPVVIEEKNNDTIVVPQLYHQQRFPNIAKLLGIQQLARLTHLKTLGDLDGMPWSALSSVPGVGEGKLQKLKNHIENLWYISDEGEEELPPSPDKNSGTKAYSIQSQQDGDGQDDAWRDVSEQLRIILTAAHELLGSESVWDALPTFQELADQLGLEQDLCDARIEDITGPGFVTKTYQAADDFITGLGERDLQILKARVIGPNTVTLKKLGDELGITPERTRQLETRVKNNAREKLGSNIDLIANIMRTQLGPVVLTSEITEAERKIFNAAERPGTALVQALLRQALDYSVDNEVGVDSATKSLIETLQAKVREDADSAGLVQTHSLHGLLPDESWFSLTPLLLKRAGLVEIFDHTALRQTNKAKIVAAMHHIGRPATKEELEELTGIKRNTVGATLSGYEGVARATVDRWWFRDQIDDEYDGIAGEIIQRIDEGGGATTLDRLLKELPELFDVQEASVLTYVNGPGFILSDGVVSRANPDLIRYRSLDDVINGRTAENLPYWVFVMEDRYLEGFSLANFPKEVARKLGAEPDSPLKVSVRSPEGCEPVTISWKAETPSGPSLGKLSGPLGKLGATAHDRIRLVIHPDSTVTLALHTDEDADDVEPDDYLQRLIGNNEI